MNLSDEKKECSICGDLFECTEYVECQNNHSMCTSCFSNQVSSQISVLSTGTFAKNNCKILCSYCKIPFSDKCIAMNTNSEVYEEFIKIKIDISTTKAVAEQEQISKTKLLQSEIERHRNHICENILTTHCNNCNAAILDFDGCFAVECNRCKASMCGWCMGDFSPDAHSHVKTCVQSLNPGSVHGTQEQFTECQKAKKTKEVKEYLNTLSSDKKSQVIVSIQKELGELNICMSDEPEKNKKQPVVQKRQIMGEREQGLLQNLRDAQIMGEIEQELLQNLRDAQITYNIYDRYNYTTYNVNNDKISKNRNHYK